MATFVAVHGAFFGGWVWKPLAKLLEGRGHLVHRPSLSGCADREHIGGPHIDLSTHIRDVAALIEFEELEDVVLIGHSYAGMVISGVAQVVPHRIAGLIHLDAFLPQDGECAVDLTGPAMFEHAKALAEERGHGWLVPFFLPLSKFCPDDHPARPWLAAMLRGVPLNPFVERFRVASDTGHLPMLFVYCTVNPLGMFDVSRDRAMRRPFTKVVDLDTEHALMLTRTDEVARLCGAFVRR